MVQNYALIFQINSVSRFLVTARFYVSALYNANWRFQQLKWRISIDSNDYIHLLTTGFIQASGRLTSDSTLVAATFGYTRTLGIGTTRFQTGRIKCRQRAWTGTFTRLGEVCHKTLLDTLEENHNQYINKSNYIWQYI